jgi:hypothetical protein
MKPKSVVRTGNEEAPREVRSGGGRAELERPTHHFGNVLHIFDSDPKVKFPRAAHDKERERDRGTRPRSDPEHA